jgi:hypothetical protein
MVFIRWQHDLLPTVRGYVALRRKLLRGVIATGRRAFHGTDRRWIFGMRTMRFFDVLGGLG